MYKPPRVFTKDQRCDKIDLHNAFFDGKKYVDTPLVHAQAIIGTRAPQNMLKLGYMTQHLIKGVDTYCLTMDGRDWLHKGVTRHLELHPEDISRCRYLPRGVEAKNAPRNTPKTAGKPAPKTSPAPTTAPLKSGVLIRRRTV